MSAHVRSSFNSRKKKSTKVNSTNDTNAIPNVPMSDEEETNLLTSRASSIHTNSEDDILGAGLLKNSNLTSGDYKSDSYEPRTPEGDSLNLQNSNDYDSNQEHQLDVRATQKKHHDISSPSEEFGSKVLAEVPIIPDYSVFSLNNYEGLEPTLENTTLFDPQSELSQSTYHPYIQRSLDNDPLLFLTSQEQTIQAQLQRNIQVHYEISKKGLSSKKIRKNILNCMDSNKNIYSAMVELYTKEFKRKGLILKAFKGWEYNKALLNRKITDIRTSENGEGMRLSQLLEEYKSVDNEIDQLETRLRQLKDKKGVLRNEIAQSQSIIESRASSYVESLEDIQKAESDTIRRLSRERTIDSGLSNTFESDKPTDQSVFSVKYYLNKFSPSLHNANDVSIESSQIIEMIARQSESFKDHIDVFSKKRDYMEQSTIIWEDISNDLNVLEDSISDVLQNQRNLNDTPNDTKTKILELLCKSLDHLNERRDSLKSMDPFLNKLIKNEISILKQGIRMIDPETINIDTLSMSDIDDYSGSIYNEKSNPSPSSSVKPKSIPKISVPQKSIESSTIDTAPALRTGSFSSTPGSFKSQLKTGFLNQNSGASLAHDEKRTKKD